MAPKKKDQYVEFFVLFGLVILFFNNIVAFIKNTTGVENTVANFVILIGVLLMVYRFTPWVDAIVRGVRG